MDSKLFKAAALFEHKFFLQIMRDHANFILDALSPNEKKEIQYANYYMKAFEKLLERADTADSEEEINILTAEVIQFLQQFRSFKLELLARLLIDKITINMVPTFINHMINELEEYLKISSTLSSGRIPHTHEIHYHLLWLPDASGHAAFIGASLDMTEKDHICEAQDFSQKFENYYMKAIELRGYMRTGIKHFPAMRTFSENIEDRISLFNQFMKELKTNIAANRTLGMLKPLALEHMIREECYYLTKIVESKKEVTPLFDKDSEEKNDLI